jgi:hypothetical protein
MIIVIAKRKGWLNKNRCRESPLIYLTPSASTPSPSEIVKVVEILIELF